MVEPEIEVQEEVPPQPRRTRKPRAKPPNGDTFDLVTPPPSRPHTTHPSRATSDYDLRDQIKPLKLTTEKLTFLVNYYIKNNGRWDDSIRALDPHLLAIRIVNTAPTSLEIGDWGGVVAFDPLHPGNDALLHIAIWNPLFLRRPSLAHATLRYAFKTWSLRRISALIPAPNFLANRLAPRYGFTLEGCIRRAFVYNGLPVAGLAYGVLPEEV